MLITSLTCQHFVNSHHYYQVVHWDLVIGIFSKIGCSSGSYEIFTSPASSEHRIRQTYVEQNHLQCSVFVKARQHGIHLSQDVLPITNSGLLVWKTGSLCSYDPTDKPRQVWSGQSLYSPRFEVPFQRESCGLFSMSVKGALGIRYRASQNPMDSRVGTHIPCRPRHKQPGSQKERQVTL